MILDLAWPDLFWPSTGKYWPFLTSYTYLIIFNCWSLATATSGGDLHTAAAWHIELPKPGTYLARQLHLSFYFALLFQLTVDDASWPSRTDYWLLYIWYTSYKWECKCTDHTYLVLFFANLLQLSFWVALPSLLTLFTLTDSQWPPTKNH